jgi:hypothetical protein
MALRPQRAFATEVYVTGGVIRLLMGAVAPPQAVHLATIGVVLLCMLSAATAVIRRRRGIGDGRRPSPSARWIAGGSAGIGLGFVSGLAWVIVDTAISGSALLAFGVPAVFRPLFLLPLVALPLVLVLVCIGLTVREWRRCRWRLRPADLLLGTVVAGIDYCTIEQ